MIKRLEEVLVLDNGFVKVYNDKVLFENANTEGNYFRLSLSKEGANYGVCIICEHEDKIVLLDNFRYAAQKFFTEVVKGMGMANKTPKETALIEVEEEIGGIVESVEELGIIGSDAADYEVFCFLVKIKEFKDVKHEETECIENIQFRTISEVKEMIKKDEIIDSITLAILSKYFAAY